MKKIIDEKVFVPLVTALWVADGNRFRCSDCGTEALDYPHSGGIENCLSPYYPNCGAKMEIARRR